MRRRRLAGWVLSCGLALVSSLGVVWAGPRFTLVCPAFEDGGLIPTSSASCEGEDLAPELKWSGVPKGTQSLAFVVEDKDSDFQSWTHWVLFNIPPGAEGLSVERSHKGLLPDGTCQGINDFNGIGWRGPCPPRGQTHRFIFRFYALDTVLTLKPECKKDELLAAMKHHTLAKTSLTGRYKR